MGGGAEGAPARSGPAWRASSTLPPLPPSEMSDAPRVRRSGFRTKSAMAANGEATEQAAEAAPEAAVSDADGAGDPPVVDDSAWMTAGPELIAAAELDCIMRDRVAKFSRGHLLLHHRDEYGDATLFPAPNPPLDMLLRVMDFKGDPLFRTGVRGSSDWKPALLGMRRSADAAYDEWRKVSLDVPTL